MLIQSMLYGTRPLDPTIFATVAATLFVVAGTGLLGPGVEGIANRSDTGIANGITTRG